MLEVRILQLKDNADFETKHKETECASAALMCASIYGYPYGCGFLNLFEFLNTDARVFTVRCGNV
jgi:hypothetical protein